MVTPNRLAALLMLPLLACGQKYYTYVGQLGTDSATLAWGTTTGAGNTIGRASVPLGRAEVRIGGSVVPALENWVVIRGLHPDTEYPYEVFLDGRKIGDGTLRTHPDKPDKLTFFVLGDFGTGRQPQYQVAAAMWKEFEKRSASGNPVRFVLTTGDNIYRKRTLGFLVRHSGNRDADWGPKFFQPYEPLLRRIPFYPTLGNHDGNESEAGGDLAVYLDNFFFPNLQPARYYKFSLGELVEFFALDTTEHTLHGPPSPAYSRDGPQHRWLIESLAASKARWKIPYFHHPPFNAGPGHASSLDSLRHFVDLFQQHGVKVVFTGHEHNFQISRQDSATGGICYVITGAGGSLRAGDVRAHLAQAHMAGWAPERHFLLVEIEDRTMRITPIGSEPITVLDQAGRPLTIPFVVTAP